MSTVVSAGVVIPTFNSAKSIRRALDSVAHQTLAPQELIVVDNGSHDETADLIIDFASEHPRLITRLHRLPRNSGPAHARNVGWQSSTADWVAFLDSDDSWHPKKLELQMRLTELYSQHSIFAHAYKVVTGVELATPSVSELQSRVSRFVLRDFLIRNRISTPTVLLRRELPYRFPEEMWYAEDFALWTELLARGHEIVYLHTPLTYLHKPVFGVAGLSAQLLKMYKGETQAVDRLRQSQSISLLVSLTVKVWMTLKFARRLLKVRLGV